MPISRILPGHGSDVTQVSELVAERLKNRKLGRKKSTQYAEGKKPMTAFEICIQLFPTLYTKQFALTLSETVGQLDFF
ncbi:hypothetical protein GCM10020331_041780 [Ectobacillus funiculus]